MRKKNKDVSIKGTEKNEIKDGFGVTIEDDGNVHVRPIEDGTIIDTPIDKIENISLDNAPISPLIQSEDEIIPKGFVKIQPKKPTTTENKIKLHNGRVYKDVGNGYGMYADNGETFRIK